MKPIIRSTFLAAVALGATACVTSSDIQKLQSQIGELQDQVA